MIKNTTFLLFLIVVSSIILRVVGFSSVHYFTFDESLYVNFGSKLLDNPIDYNSKDIFNTYSEKGRVLPDYLNKPIFKHPPLFPFLVSLSFALFGITYFSAFLVSLFFGVAMILLTYFAGKALFGKEIGIVASFIMLIEPVSWLCSQKIWLETTLSFFTVLSLYLFIRYIKDNQKSVFIVLSCVSIGFAVLTKYPGILSLVIIFTYSVLFERKLFRKKAFIFSLLIPFLMLLPWLFWNYKAYGTTFLGDMYSTHNIVYRLYWFRQKGLILGIIVLGLLFLLVNLLRKRIKFAPKHIALILFALFLIFTYKHFVNAFSLFAFPRAGWKMMMFDKESWFFYVGQLIEHSPFYIFVFGAFPFYFLLSKEDKRFYYLLLISASIIMLFYMWWKVFQSRYILAVVIFLVIIGTKHIVWIWNKLCIISNVIVRRFAMASFVIVLVYTLIKTLRVDLALVLPNAVCYF